MLQIFTKNNKKKKSFFDLAKNAKKILVLDLGFLGDSIHLIPALSCIRKAIPHAELDVIVSDHIMSIMDVAPWIDNVYGYPRFPKGPPWYKDIRRVLFYRRKGYDAIINLNGSDRSSLLTWAIGAPLRLGRIPPKIHPIWRRCFTHTIFVPRGTMPVYKQGWQCLKEVGFPGDKPEFDITVPEKVFESLDPQLDFENNFIHISPFATQDYKELPANALTEFIKGLQQQYPNLKIALSCAPNEREKNKLSILVESLNKAPWKVFPGTLSLLELAGLISRSALHLGGDSGALHIGFMTGVPTLSWFREYENKNEWMPSGTKHEALVGKASPSGIRDITVKDLLAAFNKLYKQPKQVLINEGN